MRPEKTGQTHGRRGRFSTALWDSYRSGKAAVIPDIKSRSPGEGDLLKGRDPVELAKALAGAGAPALSVVTEPEHFGGSPELLRRIASAVAVPVLRKDFIKTRGQLQESAELGAAAVLLIASMLERERLSQLVEAAFMLGLEPLVETHDESEIRFANSLDLTVAGINNRNIVKLETDGGSVDNTERLAGLVRPGVLLISESSIASPADVRRALAAGASAVLVGTAVLQAEDPAQMYRYLCESRKDGL
jgi:indole-3-glycerol phosphate synthase